MEFIKLTCCDGKERYFNAARIEYWTTHAKAGAFVCVADNENAFEVRETPAEIAAMLATPREQNESSDMLDRFAKAQAQRTEWLWDLLYGKPLPEDAAVLFRCIEDKLKAATPHEQRLTAALREAEEALEFYANVEHLMQMDGKWYEYGDSNVDLTQYNPVGTKAQKALAGAREVLNG